MYKDLIKDKNIYSLHLPTTIVPSPTKLDYTNGSIRRYFTQRVNDTNGFVFEIDSDIYQILIMNPHWKTLDMKWRSAGPADMVYDSNGAVSDMGVIASNKASIGIASTTIKNISLYLPNLLQFYIK